MICSIVDPPRGTAVPPSATVNAIGLAKNTLASQIAQLADATGTTKCLAWLPDVDRWVRCCARRMGLRDHSAIDDAVSDVRIRLAKHPYDAGRGMKESSFVFMVARCVILSALERDGTRAKVLYGLARERPLFTAHDCTADDEREHIAALTRRLSLDGDTLAYLILRGVRTVGFKGTARSLSMPEGTVKSICHRVGTRLRAGAAMLYRGPRPPATETQDVVVLDDPPAWEHREYLPREKWWTGTEWEPFALARLAANGIPMADRPHFLGVLRFGWSLCPPPFANFPARIIADEVDQLAAAHGPASRFIPSKAPASDHNPVGSVDGDE